MKIATLLTQYLYKNQRLDLPGIGTFLLDPNAMNAAENSKQRSTVMDGISFQCNPSLSDSPDLVTFISSQTGKMKPLAAADLDSHLQLAQQFLNIGKPFTFEGIGTLVKVKMKEYEFIPISVNPEKVRELHQKDSNTRQVNENTGANYESFLSTPKVKLDWGRQAIVLLLLCGLGLAIWGGYTISKRASTNAAAVNPLPVAETFVDTVDLKDDSIIEAKSTVSSNFKYVLEVAPGKRAFKRYNQLKTNLWDVHLETKDSVQYKLFLLLPSTSDTTHVLDSLTVMTGKRVFIEPNN